MEISNNLQQDSKKINRHLQNNELETSFTFDLIDSFSSLLNEGARRKIISCSYHPKTLYGKTAKKYLFWRHIEPQDCKVLQRFELTNLVERTIKVHKYLVKGEEKKIILPMIRISKWGLNYFSIYDKLTPFLDR